jgi:hypothetical protein
MLETPMYGYPEGNASGGTRWFCIQDFDSHMSLYKLWFLLASSDTLK